MTCLINSQSIISPLRVIYILDGGWRPDKCARTRASFPGCWHIVVILDQYIDKTLSMPWFLNRLAWIQWHIIDESEWSGHGRAEGRGWGSCSRVRVVALRNGWNLPVVRQMWHSPVTSLSFMHVLWCSNHIIDYFVDWRSFTILSCTGKTRVKWTGSCIDVCLQSPWLGSGDD